MTTDTFVFDTVKKDLAWRDVLGRQVYCYTVQLPSVACPVYSTVDIEVPSAVEFDLEYKHNTLSLALLGVYEDKKKEVE